jgi:hypothetical protein
MGRTWLLLFPLSAASACSASSGGAAATGADASASIGDGATVFTSCSTPVADRPQGATCVLEAKGKVEDLSGAPLGSVVVTFCGRVCYGTQSGDGGLFSIPVGQYVNTGNYALHADGRPDHAVDYLRLPGAEPPVISVTMRIPALPPSKVLLPPDDGGVASVTEGDLTLSVPAGTTFDLDIADYGTVAGRTLRVAAVPLADAPSYARAAKVDAIYALAPSGAKSSNKMGVTVTNRAKIAAGAAVDILVLGDDYFSIPPNVGTLGVAASAHVSQDGATISTDPGEGITELTWLGVRQKGK